MTNVGSGSNSFFVFLYGTLKRGQPNHEHLMNPENGSSTFVCKARTYEKMPLVMERTMNIPYLLKNFSHESNLHVLGEIFLVDRKMRDFLDWFEDHPGWYTRTPIKVVPEVHVNDLKKIDRTDLFNNLHKVLLRDVSLDEEGEWPAYTPIECDAYLICDPLPVLLDDNEYTKLNNYSNSKTKKYSEMIDSKPNPDEFAEKYLRNLIRNCKYVIE
ncbi:uncharacterized protein LOC142336994 [Convolutriloba macropyga]|uniref:uncharacterized protein LOC142336994 n=1 Tax=Convolutriloba macropyga TaxID=536237 RepID=UPI003F525EBB